MLSGTARGREKEVIMEYGGEETKERERGREKGVEERTKEKEREGREGG